MNLLFLLDLFRIRYTQDLPDLVHYLLFQVYLFARRRLIVVNRRPQQLSKVKMEVPQLNNNPSKGPAANDITSNMM